MVRLLHYLHPFRRLLEDTEKQEAPQYKTVGAIALMKCNRSPVSLTHLTLNHLLKGLSTK